MLKSMGLSSNSANYYNGYSQIFHFCIKIRPMQKPSLSNRLCRLFIKIVVHLSSHVTIIGLENLPKSGGVVAVSNHIGRLDAAYVYTHIGRQDVIMLVAEKYQKKALARWFVKSIDAIFIERFNADIRAVREVLRRIHAGGLMVIAPEGTRSKNASLQQAWTGASYLAAKAGVPVLPVGISGTEDAQVKAHLKRLRRVQVTVHVGKPFILPPLPKEDREATLRRYTDEIMCQIAALLPPPYRGVYANHPRLLELL
jgi:1-acyl-sn-glycerol-3-phosphate acyltransferase